MPVFVTTDGTEIFYRAVGTGEAHALFVHPFMHDGTIWLDSLRALGDIRRCIAVDLRGHGRSDPNTHPAVVDSHHIADLVELVDRLPGKIDLVGLAFGGNLCAGAWEARPDRIRSLTMISSSFGDSMSDPVTRRYTYEFGRMAVMEDKGVVFRRAMDYIFGPDAPLFAKARYRGVIERTPAETYVAFYCNADITPRPDLPGRIAVPVFIPHGDHDAAYDPDGPMAAIPDLTTHCLPGAGRLLPIEAPAAFNAALRDFWERRS